MIIASIIAKDQNPRREGLQTPDLDAEIKHLLINEIPGPDPGSTLENLDTGPGPERRVTTPKSTSAASRLDILQTALCMKGRSFHGIHSRRWYLNENTGSRSPYTGQEDVMTAAGMSAHLGTPDTLIADWLETRNT